MKTKFTINDEIFLDNGTLEQCFDYYEKHYKKEGFILDKENQDCYKIFDREIKLDEGDRIWFSGVCDGIKLIKWKCYDVDNDIMEYSTKDE